MADLLPQYNFPVMSTNPRIPQYPAIWWSLIWTLSLTEPLQHFGYRIMRTAATSRHCSGVKKYSLISIQPTVSKKGSRLILPASALWNPLILFYMLHRSYRSIFYNIKNIIRAYSNSPHCQTCLPKVKSSLPTQYNKSIFSFVKESKIVHNSTILTEALHGCSKISFHLSSNLKSLMKYKWTRAQFSFLC